MDCAQLLAQLLKSHICLSFYRRAQKLLHVFTQIANRAMALLPRSFRLARGQLLAPDLLAIPVTDSKLLRQFLQAATPTFVGLQQL